MPNRFQFDELPARGTIRLRCIWCPFQAPAGASETLLRNHHRKHRKDIQQAEEASRKEVTLAQTLAA